MPNTLNDIFAHLDNAKSKPRIRDKPGTAA